MNRPYFSSSVAELESLFDGNLGNLAVLQALQHELMHRSAKRAVHLRSKIEAALGHTPSKPPPPSTPEFDFGDKTIPSEPPPKTQPPSPARPQRPKPEAQPPPSPSGQAPPQAKIKRKWSNDDPAPFPPVSNRPPEILDAWSAIEILSPPTFDRPQSLAGGDSSRVVRLDELALPWERGERSRPNQRLYYQVVLGSVELEPAIEALVERFGDSRAERPSARGNAVLAALVVDKSGKLVEDPAIGVSSFGWGLMTSLASDLADLAGWPDVEKRLVDEIESALRPPEVSGEDEEWRSKPLTRQSIERAHRALVSMLGLPDEWVHSPDFAIRSYVYFKDPSPPEPLLLNSFFLGDLATAKRLFLAGEANHNLKAYLGAWVPPLRSNILEDTSVLESALRPLSTPLARWPSNGRHPLALLQQVGVNLAFSKTTPEGIIGINGPPGTGKTTLLRDVLANVIADRATALLGFADPEDAFEHSGEKLMVGGSWLHLYRLHSSLRGFEMVVASSNNKAVENVSAELPGLAQIADDAPHLRYFKTLSDTLHGSETWGAIAAVLGNAQNKSKFKQQFWWDEDSGLNNYLRAASGSRQEVQVENPDTGIMELKLPRIVLSEDPPISKKDALKRWEAACKRFKDVREKCLSWFAWLESLRTDLERTPGLHATKRAALDSEHRAVEHENRTRTALDHAETQHGAIQGEIALLTAKEEELFKLRTAATQSKAGLSNIEATLRTHEKNKPGAIRQLFNRQCISQWQLHLDHLRSALEAAKSQYFSCADKLQQIEATWASDLNRLSGLRVNQQHALSKLTSAAKEHERALTELRDAKYQSQQAGGVLAKALERLAEARVNHGATLLDQEFWGKSHEQRQTSSAWFTDKSQRAREELFIAAIQLHKAFIDAAAKPLRHNLGALMNVFSSQALPTPAKQALLGDLWSTLFLVVPLVSTTFASVQRMLGRLPVGGLGWLLIDEAGQAVPQAAVGAIMRSKRVVVLGDPIQIEPVVTLPDFLTQSILRRFGIDPDRFGAPVASVQTLADAASPVMAEFPTKHGSRFVGVPLLVHRRCSSPMFEIANNIAYAGLMVSAKKAKPSLILDCLGPSRWIEIEGGGQDKWCEEEGTLVLKMLQKLRTNNVDPSLYIVSPFVIVAEKLRQLVLKSKVLQGWVDEDDWAWVNTRIGTVHTAQGREAEAVIFVLGAPNPAQTGARGWAGSRPNLLNVAVTRAKEAVYVIGNRRLWREAGVFGELDIRIGG